MAQSTHRLSFFAAAGLVLIEGSALPLLKAPLFAVGLKLCGGGGIKRKPSPLGEGAPVRTLGRMRGSLTVWFMSRFVGPLVLWRAAYSLYLPPCRGKVSWPTAMTDEGALSDSSRNVQRPFLFPCRKKKRFLESKEKGAFEIWCAVGCPAAACVFTPPWGTGPGRYGLCGRNREKRMFYLPAA